MNKRERILAAANRQPVDRVPVAFWRHFPGDDQRAADLAEATIAFQSKYDFDFVKVSPANSHPAGDWGAVTAFRGNMEGTRDYLERPITQASDWRTLKPLDVTQGILGESLATLRLLKAAWGDTAPFIQTVFSPLMVARYLRGDTLWFVDMREHPADFAAGIEVITESMSRFARAAIEAGAAGLFFALQNATYRHVSESEYRASGLPNDLKIIESANAAGAWFTLLHMHGDDIMFQLVKEYPVQAVNWHDRTTRPSLREARSQFGGALVGGVAQHTTLLTGTPADVSVQVRDALAQTGGIGHIVGAGCVLPIPTPESNIKAAINTVLTHV
ncbi:MAG: uroporphyrinogen decarboxylase [Chloroflexi bacterium]|nr:uroporphyrinogen decarboxylase [Chloroflexota bacterium]